MTPEEEIKDPFVLEFLGLKDEYSESDLENALIAKLESFLLELGSDFAFVGRQRRLRIGSQWFRVDLVFFNRRLRCLVIIDLKLGHFTHADAGQMHLYLKARHSRGMAVPSGSSGLTRIWRRALRATSRASCNGGGPSSRARLLGRNLCMARWRRAGQPVVGLRP